MFRACDVLMNFEAMAVHNIGKWGRIIKSVSYVKKIDLIIYTTISDFLAIH